MADLTELVLSLLLENEDEETTYEILSNDAQSLQEVITHCSHHDIPLLHHACHRGYSKVVRLLGDNNIDVNRPSSDGTPLQVASELGHADIVSYLLEHGACGNTEAVWQEASPFYRATKNNHINVLRQLYSHLQMLVVDTDVRMSLLYAACLHGQRLAVKFWYSPEINLNQPIVYVTTFTDCTEMTPLYAACSRNHDDVVAYLIDLDVTITPFICESFPDIIGRVLLKHNSKYLGVDKELLLNWSRLHLCVIPPLWLTLPPDHIVHLNISHNLLKHIPPCIPWSLPHLHSLDVSHNQLTQLPTQESCDPAHLALSDINIHHNRLSSIPLQYFMLPSLKKLTASDNKMTSLVHHPNTNMTDPEWGCVQLERLEVSGNDLTSLPDQLRRCMSLVKLYACRNRLTSLPEPWPCKLGMLLVTEMWSMDRDCIQEMLNATHNELTDFPPSIHNIWSLCLRQLYLSHNHLNELRVAVVQLESLEILDVSHNVISQLAPESMWTCRHLMKLNLGHNLLGPAVLTPTSPKSSFFTKMKLHSKTKDSPEDQEIIFPSFLSSCLSNLNLSHNGLTSFPESVSKLASLKILNLSLNPSLVSLSPSLAKLIDCQLIKLSGCNISNVPNHLLEETAEATELLLSHLKLLLRRCQPCYRLKMIVLGKKDHGKTSLIAALTDITSIDYSSERLALYDWTLTAKSGGLRKPSIIKLSRDRVPPPLTSRSTSGTCPATTVSRTSSTTSTHQCILPGRVEPAQTTGTVAIRLRYHLNIQVCHPNTGVLVVATHADKVNTPLPLLLEQVKAKLQSSVSWKGSRAIVMDVVGVSSVTSLGMDDLKAVIYHLVMGLTSTGNGGPIPLMGRMIPQSYAGLQRLLVAEREERGQRGELAILQDADMLELVDRVEGNDVTNTADLAQCLRFIHDQGDMLSFDDKLHGSLYMLDPVWLFDLLSHILLSSCLASVVENGITDIERLMGFLPQDTYPAQHRDIYLQLLERFNIAMMLDPNKLIVPSQIPRTKPAVVSSNQNAIHRYFKLSFIPPGFWPLVITKIWISLFRYSNLSWHTATPMATGRLNSSVKLNRQKSGKKLKRHSIIPWHDGIKILHSSGCIVVESAGWQTEINDRVRPGILVTVESHDNDFVPVGFIVDELEDILLDCYRGIDLSEVFALCSTCIHISPDKVTNTLFLGNIDHFLISQCCLAIYNDHHLECPRWHSYASLDTVVPELLLTDLPPHLRVDASKLTLHTSTVLGRGNFGLVLCGDYCNQAVAVKIFPASATKVMWYIHNDADSGDPTFSYPSTHESYSENNNDTLRSQYNAASLDYHTGTTDESVRIKVHMSFSNMRREATLLSQLHHPCIVAMIGFCIQPMSLVMELAPLGDLRDLLNTLVDQRLLDLTCLSKRGDVFTLAMSRHLTYKCVYQICRGLRYLHSRDIIYRDLKSDNVLVYSCDLTTAINVKLSDYGISKFMTPQGMMGMCGTKGYQAPEILLAKMYDEKVDMYSLSSVIYEIISGLRPADSNKTLMDMQRSVRAGVVPSLKTPDYTIQSRLPYLECLMQRCWSQDPTTRPSAHSVVMAMADVSFVCECHDVKFPSAWQLGVVDCAMVFTVTETTSTSKQLLWLWEGTEAQRRYHILDVDLGLYRVTHVPCPGPQVVAMTRVNKCLWLATVSNTVEIHSVEETNALVCLQQINVMAEPSSLLHSHLQESQSLVVVMTRAGTLHVVSHETDTPAVVTQQVDVFSGACANYLLTFVGHDIWAAGNNTVRIIDQRDFVVRDQIERIFPFGGGHVESLVTDQERVWCSSGWSVAEMCVESLSITRIFNVDGDVINGVTAANLVPFSSGVSTETGDLRLLCGDADTHCDTGVAETVTTTRAVINLDDILPIVPRRTKQQPLPDERIYCNVNVHAHADAEGETRTRSFTDNLVMWRKNIFKRPSPFRVSEADVGNLNNNASNFFVKTANLPPVPPKRRQKKTSLQTPVSVQPNMTQIVCVKRSLWIATQNGRIAVLDASSGAVTALLSASCNPAGSPYIRRFLVGNENVVSLLGVRECSENNVIVWDKVDGEDIDVIRGYNASVTGAEKTLVQSLKNDRVSSDNDIGDVSGISDNQTETAIMQGTTLQ